MDFKEKKGPEPDLYQTDSGPRQGQVTQIKNLRDLEEIPSVWTKVHLLSEKLGAETIGVEQLPEEARNPNQKPYSKSRSQSEPSVAHHYFQVPSSSGVLPTSTTLHSRLELLDPSSSALDGGIPSSPSSSSTFWLTSRLVSYPTLAQDLECEA